VAGIRRGLERTKDFTVEGPRRNAVAVRSSLPRRLPFRVSGARGFRSHRRGRFGFRAEKPARRPTRRAQIAANRDLEHRSPAEIRADGEKKSGSATTHRLAEREGRPAAGGDATGRGRLGRNQHHQRRHLGDRVFAKAGGGSHGTGGRFRCAAGRGGRTFKLSRQRQTDHPSRRTGRSRPAAFRADGRRSRGVLGCHVVYVTTASRRFRGHRRRLKLGGLPLPEGDWGRRASCRKRTETPAQPRDQAALRASRVGTVDRADPGKTTESRASCGFCGSQPRCDRWPSTSPQRKQPGHSRPRDDDGDRGRARKGGQGRTKSDFQAA